MHVEEDGVKSSIKRFDELFCQLEEWNLSSDLVQRALDKELEQSQGLQILGL